MGAHPPPLPMTDDQSNRHDMHQTVLEVLDTHAEAWASAPAVQGYRDALGAFIERVREAARTQTRGTKGVTNDKAKLRDDVAERSWRLGQALVSWGEDNGRPDVVGAVARTRRAFTNLKDSDLAEYSEVVVAEAREHLPADGEDPTTGLGALGVTAAFVDALDGLDDAFAAALSTPRSAIVARKGAGREIAQAQRGAYDLLTKRLDPAVAFLAPDHPAFAAAYRDARIIVDRGRGPSADPDDDVDDSDGGAGPMA